MNYFLMLVFVASCGTYTDPESAKLTYYLCDKKHSLAVKHSDDYNSVLIDYDNKGQQILLHHFVTAERTGYSTENLLWLTQGKKGVLVEKLDDGSEKILYKECIAEK
jgi:membrane-bound inhibitor of C-type lysozyme